MTQPDAEVAAPTTREASRLVTRLDIQRFSHAVGEAGTVHHDVEAARSGGYADLVAPAHFFAALGLALSQEVASDGLRHDGLVANDDVGANIVAAGTTIDWAAPIIAGETVTVRESLVGETEKSGSSGRLVFYTYRREYSVGGDLRVVEEYVKVSRS